MTLIETLNCLEGLFTKTSISAFSVSQNGSISQLSTTSLINQRTALPPMRVADCARIEETTAGKLLARSRSVDIWNTRNLIVTAYFLVNHQCTPQNPKWKWKQNSWLVSPREDFIEDVNPSCQEGADVLQRTLRSSIIFAKLRGYEPVTEPSWTIAFKSFCL